MVYGMILINNGMYTRQKQRAGIVSFAEKSGFNIDSFMAYSENPNLDIIKPGDSVVFYAWSCISRTRPQLKKCLDYFVKNRVCFYSSTSNLCIDKNFDFNQLAISFDVYEDIRFDFVSNKNVAGVHSRIAMGKPSGCHTGAKNKKHIWDRYESKILSMHANGDSMYSIAKELNLNAPAVKRCLVANNIKEV